MDSRTQRSDDGFNDLAVAVARFEEMTLAHSILFAER